MPSKWQLNKTKYQKGNSGRRRSWSVERALECESKIYTYTRPPTRNKSIESLTKDLKTQCGNISISLQIDAEYERLEKLLVINDINQCNFYA